MGAYVNKNFKSWRWKRIEVHKFKVNKYNSHTKQYYFKQLPTWIVIADYLKEELEKEESYPF